MGKKAAGPTVTKLDCAVYKLFHKISASESQHNQHCMNTMLIHVTEKQDNLYCRYTSEHFYYSNSHICYHWPALLANSCFQVGYYKQGDWLFEERAGHQNSQIHFSPGF